MISGSRAAFSMIVLPLALTAASITLIVAPMETISKKIRSPVKPSSSVRKYMAPCSLVTFAPSASKPLICKSIGRGPKKQPPGNPTTPSPNFANNAPMK